MVAAVSTVEPIEVQLRGYAKQFAAMILAEARSLIAGEQFKESYTTDKLPKRWADQDIPLGTSRGGVPSIANRQ